MTRTRRPLALATVAGAALALGAAAGPAQATTVPCFTSLPGPSGQSWQLQNDGGVAASLHVNANSALDQGYASIKVGGVAYPNTPQNCDKIGDVVNYPKKTLGGLEVSRSVSVTNGRLRWVDTIRNPANVSKPLALDVALEVLGSQDIVGSESGDAFGTSDDHWSVHKSGALFSFSQWGEGSNNAIDPVLDPEDPVPAWQPFAGVMGDATLHYGAGVPNLAPGQTMRFLHAAGATTAGQAAATAAADDAGAAFAGFSKDLAAQIVNWGTDPDGDGVDKTKDECPGFAGNQPNGCVANQPPPPPADPSDPAGPGESGGTGTGTGSGAGSGSGGSAGTLPPAKPRAYLGVPKKLSRKALSTGLGVAFSVQCNVACKTTVSLSVRGLKSKRFRTLKSTSRGGYSLATRKLRIKVRPAQLKGLQAGARVVVKVTDKNGVSATFSRPVRFVK